MPGHQYTPGEYPLQRIVESFGNLLFALAEHSLTHTYTVVFHLCQLQNIDYIVLRYLNTGALPFVELCNEWSFDGEAKSSSTSEMGIGIVSIWIHWNRLHWNLPGGKRKLWNMVKRLSLRIRRGKKESLDRRLYFV